MFATIISFILLGIIINQLDQLLKIKRIESEERKKDRVDRRIKALMPHLFIDSKSEEQLEQIREFFDLEVSYWKQHIAIDYPGPADYYFKEMEKKIEEEKDNSKKETMEKYLTKVRQEVKEILDKIIKEREITQTEIDFILWDYSCDAYMNFYPIDTENEKIWDFGKSLKEDLYISLFPKKNQ